MTTPTKVKLDTSEQLALKALHDKTVGLNNFVQTVTAQGESRMAEIQAESRRIWEKIAANHGLDIEHVNYEVDAKTEHLVPMMMKL